jgi:site-specific DNA recombinase
MGSKAIVYVRVSTEGQVESGLGLADQEARCRAYCEMRGLEVAEVIVDPGVSAGKPLGDREGGAAVLRQTRRRRAPLRHVVALKLDRLFRNAADALEVTAQWDKRKVALHLVDFGGGAIDLSTAMGRMFLTMAAGFAELERGLTSERTKAALAVKRSRGEFTGGAAPLGFRLVRGTLRPESAEQDFLTRLVQLRDEGRSYAAVAKALNDEGHRTRKGGTWSKARVHALYKRQAAA